MDKQSTETTNGLAMPNTNVAASAAWAVASLRRDPAAIRHLFESGEYPDKTLMRAKSRNAHVLELQRELLKAQRWIEKSGQRIVVLFEGRDAAGKGGTIKRFTRHINPRTARVVALQKPIERERTQRYFQRYIAPLPAAGEIVLFDRSWHNRTGVERVMSFRPPNDYLEFMRRCPDVEHMLVRSEITLIKFWFSVSCEEQRRRLIVGSSAYVIGTGPGIINKAVHPSAKRDREISAA